MYSQFSLIRLYREREAERERGRLREREAEREGGWERGVFTVLSDQVMLEIRGV